MFMSLNSLAAFHNFTAGYFISIGQIPACVWKTYKQGPFQCTHLATNIFSQKIANIHLLPNNAILQQLLMLNEEASFLPLLLFITRMLNKVMPVLVAQADKAVC